MQYELPITLTPGESLRFSTLFSPHLILSHLKVTLVVTDRRVVVRRPNTIFGAIPLGFIEKSTPIRHVSQVTVGEEVSTKKLLYGIGAVLSGLLSLFGGAFAAGPTGILLGLIMLPLAAYFFLTARELGIWVRNHGAGVLLAPAGGGERQLVEQAGKILNELLFGDSMAEIDAAMDGSGPPAPIMLGQAAPSAPAAAHPAYTTGSRAAYTTGSQPAYTTGSHPIPVSMDAARAADPRTPATVLYDIAQRAPELRPQIAQNPATYPDLLKWLADLGDPEITRALTQRVS